MGQWDFLCDLPAAAPPAGVTPNFEDPVTLIPEIISVSTVFMAASLVFVGGRLYAIPGKFTLADYFIALALVFSMAQGGLLFAQLKWARHQWDVRACWFFGNYAKLIFSQQMMLTPGMLLAKASILLLFKNIFTVDRSLNMVIWGAQVLNILTYLPAIPVEVVFNAPYAGDSWEELMASGKPTRAIYWGVVQSVMAIVLDLYIFCIPMPSIMKLSMSSRKRGQVVAVFSTALMGVVAAVVSLVYRVLEMNDAHDSTWKLYIILLCTVVELNVAIVVACAAGFSRFVRVYLSQCSAVKSIHSKFSSYVSSSGNHSGPANAKTWPINLTTRAAKDNNSRDVPAQPPIAIDEEAGRHQYYELNNMSDSWLMQTNNSTIVAAEPSSYPAEYQIYDERQNTMALPSNVHNFSLPR
ncbi:hypothetical protein QBC43DRAFT_284242 [Cladorrhinum sp. PSN259]|nr:hypothetical protein QBC43DRAFT_284242 [Cladorrhinum sp. PSN259]